MGVNLDRAFETDNGVIVGETIIPQSIVETIRSAKPTYTGDLLTSIDYYNSLTQVDANRVTRSSFTYDASDKATTQTDIYYKPDGVTSFKTEAYTYVYSGDDFLRVEVS